VHAGFSGLRAFVARKKSRCKLIGNRFVIPHDTIPSTVMRQCRENSVVTDLRKVYTSREKDSTPNVYNEKTRNKNKNGEAENRLE